MSDPTWSQAEGGEGEKGMGVGSYLIDTYNRLVLSRAAGGYSWLLPGAHGRFF